MNNDDLKISISSKVFRSISTIIRNISVIFGELNSNGTESKNTDFHVVFFRLSEGMQKRLQNVLRLRSYVSLGFASLNRQGTVWLPVFTVCLAQLWPATMWRWGCWGHVIIPLPATLNRVYKREKWIAISQIQSRFRDKPWVSFERWNTTHKIARRCRTSRNIISEAKMRGQETRRIGYMKKPSSEASANGSKLSELRINGSNRSTAFRTKGANGFLDRTRKIGVS